MRATRPVFVFAFALSLACMVSPLSAGGKKEEKRSVLIILDGKGFSESILAGTPEYLAQWGLTCDISAPDKANVISDTGRTRKDVRSLTEVSDSDYSALLIVPSTSRSSLMEDSEYVEIIGKFYREKKIIGATGNTVVTLNRAGILSGQTVSLPAEDRPAVETALAQLLPGGVSVSDQIVTSAAEKGSPYEEFLSKFITTTLERIEGRRSVLPREAPFTPIAFTKQENGERFVVSFEGQIRTGALIMPGLHHQTDKAPLLVAFGDGTQSGQSFVQKMELTRLSQTLGFTVIAADPLPSSSFDKPSEAVFAAALVRSASTYLNSDSTRIHAFGTGSGALCAGTLAVDNPSLISSLVTVSSLPRAGGLGKETLPLSLLHFHVLEDTEARYPQSGSDSFIAVEGAIETWLTATGPMILDERPLYTNELLPGYALSQWKNESGDRRVVLALAEKGAPKWPSGALALMEDFLYHHPSRASRSRVRRPPGGEFLTGGGRVRLALEGGAPIGCSRVTYFVNGEKAVEADAEPFEGNLTLEEKGLWRLSARIEFARGEYVDTTFNPVFVSTRRDLLDGSIGVQTTPSRPGQTDAWIDLSFDRLLTLDGATLAWKDSAPESYSLEISHDGLSWRELWHGEGVDNQISFVDFNAVTARYLRISIPAGGDKPSEAFPLRRILLHGRSN
ncbi:MAG: DJ-1/PfpI family protein [Spirochaetales bacterium]|nr:DJ-1/PfpI family protein [Spirochaetales bacterium]